jgi:hypothetical protein
MADAAWIKRFPKLNFEKWGGSKTIGKYGTILDLVCMFDRMRYIAMQLLGFGFHL